MIRFCNACHWTALVSFTLLPWCGNAATAGAGDEKFWTNPEFISAFVGSYGVKSEIEEIDVGTAWTMTTKGDYQAYVSYITSDINDTDELATIQADVDAGSQAFFTWYANKDVQKMLTEARMSSDQAKRAELYAKVQEIVYNDGYSIPLNFAPVINGSQSYVKDFKQLANGWWWLQKVWLDK